MSEWSPSERTRSVAQEFVKDFLGRMPTLLGIDEIITGCELLALDPFGVGVGVTPRYVTVSIREFTQHVWYTGALGLTIGDDYTVVHTKDGDRYELLGASGTGGASGGGWVPPPGLVLGTGIANQVAYWSAVDTIAGDAGFTYDPATDTATLLGSLVLNPFGVDDANIIQITPSAAITTIDAEWDGIEIDGSALDPTVVDVDIHGMHIDLSGVSIANEPHIDGLHIETPTTHHGHGHGIHLDGLGLRVDHDDTTAVAGETHTVIDVIINDAGSTGGETHALDVARTGGGALAVEAVGTHSGVGVIHQHVGAFAGAAKAWRYVDIGPVWTDATVEFDGGVNLQIFAADDDVIYVSGTALDTMFDEIEVILTVAASKHIHPVFEYSVVAGPGWTVFSPSDDTDGFQNSGVIRFDSATLALWARTNVNGEGGGATLRYWIRITRTRNNVPTPPTEGTIRVLMPTTYSWDELGNLSVLAMVVAATAVVDDNDVIDALRLEWMGW